MNFKLLKDLNFAERLGSAVPMTEAAQNVVKNYQAYLFINPANCAVVNSFIKEARQYGYDRGMAKILDGITSFISENRISWQLATACESIVANNSTYSYIAKLGIDKVEKLLEMDETNVVSYIKAGALRGVKYIPEFREICKEVYKTQVNESVQTVKYEMHTPFCYTLVTENGDHIISVGNKSYAINENSVKEIECTDPTYVKVNAHLGMFKQIGEAIEYNYGGFTFSIAEGKDDTSVLSLKKGDKVLSVFEDATDFLRYCDTYSRAVINGRQFMTIAGAVSEVFENANNIVFLDNVREFNCSNGTKAYVLEAKDNVISVANGITSDCEFMVEALANIEKNCGTDVKVVYENRINEDLKKGNPEQYAAIREELQRTKDAQAEIRYKKIEQLSESLKNNPAAIAVLNSVAKELRVLEERERE